MRSPTRPPVWVPLARWSAIAIAVLAAVDPAITTARRTEAIVAVVPASPADSAVADRVANGLNDDFIVVRGPLPSAAATVLTGSGLPESVHALAAPVFAVLPERADESVRVQAVDAPASAALNTRVTVWADLDAAGIAGRDVDVTLQSDGVSLDRATVRAPAAGRTMRVPLSFVPDRPGAHALTVRAVAPDVEASAGRVVTIDVHESDLAVLFFDGRPAWLSTFVRRALERDPRFTVTSRIATSRGVATEAGQPPARLGDAAAIADFDAIVIGAPEALTAADVAGLEAYMRRRGGSVVLLLDRRAAGPYERLTGAVGWTAAELDSPTRIDATAESGLTLSAAELVTPARLPAGSHVLARAADTDAPVIWRTAVGGGRLVVSGAADAWRFRDPEASDFDAYFRALIGDVASAAPDALDITFAGGADAVSTAPGERVHARLTVRSAALADPAGGTAAIVTASVDGRPVRFWPDAEAGSFSATFRAPAATGTYELVAYASDDGATAGAEASGWVVVRDEDMARGGGSPGVGVAGATIVDDAVVSAWATSREGATLPASRLSELPGLLRDRLSADRRREPWHPMRSAWWILPFAAALGAEWLWRRRRGLA